MTALVQRTPFTFYSLNSSEKKEEEKIRETVWNQIVQDLETIVGRLDFILVAVDKGKDQKKSTF